MRPFLIFALLVLMAPTAWAVDDVPALTAPQAAEDPADYGRVEVRGPGGLFVDLPIHVSVLGAGAYRFAGTGPGRGMQGHNLAVRGQILPSSSGQGGWVLRGTCEETWRDEPKGFRIFRWERRQFAFLNMRDFFTQSDRFARSKTASFSQPFVAGHAAAPACLGVMVRVRLPARL